jgi:hypothetical protein
VALGATIAGCGGGSGDAGNTTTPLSVADDTTAGSANQTMPVSYDGTALIVRAIRYERLPGIELCNPAAICENGVLAYAPGQVIVFFSAQNAQNANALMAELGLTIRSVSAESLIVNVPVLYERQWVAALLREPVLQGAEVNPIRTIG